MKTFAKNPGLVQRYPDAPAAKGVPTSSLKSFVTDRLGHDRRYAIDCSRIERELGYRALAGDFAAGFSATLAWYLQNQDWLRFKRA